MAPKVIEGLLGTRLRGREFGREPIVTGSRNTLAVTADGDVYAWGWNDRGTLGHGHRNPVLKPKRIQGLRDVRVVQVALGGWHALALDKEGRCWAWGGNEYSQCAGESAVRDVLEPRECMPQLRVCQVDAGGMHSVALTENGQIWTWGEQWGDFSMTINRDPRRIDETGDFVRVSCGAFHNLALTMHGEVYTWGINDYGQLGNGTTSYATVPKKITEGLEGVKISDIAAGGWHSVAISDEGRVYVWGRGEYGRLGLGDKTGASRLRPTLMESLKGMRIVEASCGGTHTVVVTDDGRVFTWGRGSFGRLGTATERNHYSPVEVKLPGGPERWWIISAAAGGRHTLVLAVPDNGDLEVRQLSWANRTFAPPVGRGLSPRPSSIPSSISGRGALETVPSGQWQSPEVEPQDTMQGGESPDGDADDEGDGGEEDEEGEEEEADFGEDEQLHGRSSSEAEKELADSISRILGQDDQLAVEDTNV